MLDEMQTQWLAVVGEGRAHAMLGLTLRGMCRGNFPTQVLVRILGFSGVPDSGQGPFVVGRKHEQFSIVMRVPAPGRRGGNLPHLLLRLRPLLLDHHRQCT
jgi:hypothetical protein